MSRRATHVESSLSSESGGGRSTMSVSRLLLLMLLLLAGAVAAVYFLVVDDVHDDDNDGASIADAEEETQNVTTTFVPTLSPLEAQDDTTTPTTTVVLPTLAPTRTIIIDNNTTATIPPSSLPSFTTTTTTPTTGDLSSESTQTTMTPAVLVCNGLASLCDRSASDIMYGTLHNAMATVDDGIAFFPNHQQSLLEALEAGFRGINLDIGKCNNDVRLAHSFCSLGSIDPVVVWTTIATFLSDHPHEVLVMPTQINYELGGPITLTEIYQTMLQVDGFVSRLYAHNVTTTSNNNNNSDNQTNKPWPSLRQLIQWDKRILFFHYNGQDCAELQDLCPIGFHDWFRFAAETPFRYTSVNEFVIDTTTAEAATASNSCRLTRGQNGFRDFIGLNLFLTIPSREAATVLNDATFLSSQVDACSAHNGDATINLLIVDFWSTGNLMEFVQDYNAALAT